MAKWDHPDIVDGGLLAIKNDVTKMILIADYTAGDSYATVQANKIAEVTMGSSDFTLGTSGTSRTLTSATKSATATASSASGDHHVAFTDGVSRVLTVTDETAEVAVTSGQTVNFSAMVRTQPQPT